jgi:hypothetical protein
VGVSEGGYGYISVDFRVQGGKKLKEQNQRFDSRTKFGKNSFWFDWSSPDLALRRGSWAMGSSFLGEGGRGDFSGEEKKEDRTGTMALYSNMRFGGRVK